MLDEYVAARAEQYNLQIAPQEFWAAASEQHALIPLVEYQANFVAGVGIGLILLAIPAWHFGVLDSPALLAIAIFSTSVGFTLSRAGFNRDTWLRAFKLHGIHTLDFRLASQFDVVFGQVMSREHPILELDKAGIGVFNSTASQHPVTKAYGPQALGNPKFPATLFQEEATLGHWQLQSEPSLARCQPSLHIKFHQLVTN
jgi:hypothetical protein